MANFSALNLVITDLFSVIDTLITAFVDLLTGNLIILIVVTAVIGLVVAVIVLIAKLIREQFSKSIKMK